jgi:hypothetical protein
MSRRNNDGIFIELPCKKNDILYTFDYDVYTNEEVIKSVKCHNVGFDGDFDNYAISVLCEDVDGKYFMYTNKDFNKFIFHTYEEAEKVLKQRKLLIT